MRKFPFAVRKYRRALYRSLSCCRDTKNQLMGTMDLRLLEYIREHPGNNYAGLVDTFGTPEDFAGSYLNSLDTADILQSIRKRNWGSNALLTLALLLLFALTVLSGYHFKSAKDSLGEYSVVTWGEPCRIDEIRRSKNYDKYSASGTLLWRVTLTASFTYNGDSATCTGSNCSVTVFDNAWLNLSKNVIICGNSTYARFTMYDRSTLQNITDTLSLSCSGTGDLS